MSVHMLLECLCKAVVWFIKFSHTINVEKSPNPRLFISNSVLSCHSEKISHSWVCGTCSSFVDKRCQFALCECVWVCACVSCCNCERELNLWISSCIITHLGRYLWPFLVDALNMMARHWSSEQVQMHDSPAGPCFCLFCRKGQVKCCQGPQTMAKWHLWRRFLSTTSANRAAVDILHAGELVDGTSAVFY